MKNFILKIDNIEKMSKLVERHSLSKHTQANREYSSSLISLKEIEFLAKNLPTKETAGTVLASLVCSTEYFRKK